MTRKKPRVNCGPQLIDRVRTITSSLYNHCRQDVRSSIPFPSDEEISKDAMAIENFLKEVKVKASTLYQQRLKTLPTKDLEDILWVHHKGHYRRAPETLEGITGELAKRELFGVATKEDDIV